LDFHKFYLTKCSIFNILIQDPCCWGDWVGSGFEQIGDIRNENENELKTYSTILYHTTGVHHVERRTTLNNVTEKCARGTSTTCVYTRTEIISYLLLSDEILIDHEQITRLHVLGKHQGGIQP